MRRLASIGLRPSTKMGTMGTMGFFVHGCVPGPGSCVTNQTCKSHQRTEESLRSSLPSPGHRGAQ